LETTVMRTIMYFLQSRTARHFIGVAALLAAAGCFLDTGPGWHWAVQPGTVAVDHFNSDVLSSPDTVVAGTPFTVVVNTFGSSSCTRPAGSNATLSGLTATVVPLDSVVVGDMVCTSDLRSFPHSVSLTFGAPGDATVAIAGRGDHGDTTLIYAIAVR
jgi:hypothetical protein